MYRIKQFRPNLRTHGLVRVRQWSEKNNINEMLNQMRYENSILGHDITSVHIITDEENIVCVWFECSNPNYSWDNGFFRFMVTFRPRTMKERLAITKEEINSHLSRLVETAGEYFNAEEMEVSVRWSEL